MLFVKMAFLGMFKHPKRLVLILFAIVASVVMMEVVSGMMEGLRDNFFTNMLGDSGHVQVHAAGYDGRVDPWALEPAIPDYGRRIAELSAAGGGAHAEPVLTFGAMLANGERNVTIAGYGVSADTAFFGSYREKLVRGSFLDGAEGIVVSDRIATLLDADTGDYLSVVVEDIDGALYYMDYAVAGVFDTGSREKDENAFFMEHTEAESLLGLYGATMEIRVELPSHDRAGTWTRGLGPWLARHALEAKDWEAIHGGMAVLLKFFDVFLQFFNLLLVVVSATVIMNTLLVNVLERSREYGTLRAVGLKKRQLFGLIVAEGLFEGLVGAAVGIAFGASIVLVMRDTGVNFGDISESIGLTSALRFRFAPGAAVVNFAWGAAIAFFASVYAAGICARKNLMAALNGK